MKVISGLISLFTLAAFIILGGCGGGGSSDSSAPTKATVKLSTQGPLPQGTLLSGIAVTIQLPAGVTVDTTSGAVSAGVVTVTGVAAQGGASVLGPQTYTPASGASRGTLAFTLAANNFGTGEFATVNFNLAPGSSAPSASDVAIAPADQSLRPVSALSVVLAVDLH
jgi:hypothetical protein